MQESACGNYSTRQHAAQINYKDKDKAKKCQKEQCSSHKEVLEVTRHWNDGCFLNQVILSAEKKKKNLKTV